MDRHDYVSITIYCCQGGKRWHFGRNPTGRWILPPARGLRYRGDVRLGFESATGRPLTRVEAQYAAASEALSGAEPRYVFRYNLRCESCSTTVPASEQKLNPIFESHGASEMSLKELRAKLSGSAER